MFVRRLFKPVLSIVMIFFFLQLTNFWQSPLKKVDLEFKIPVSYEEVEQFIQIDEIKVRIFATFTQEQE
jgi:hypothetical protein